MEITNKTLGLLLIAAIVVSLGGTFVSLNKLGGTSATGYATNNETGQVFLSVGTALSILVTDASIDFGSCAPQAQMIFLDSENALVGDNTNCQSGTFPDYLEIENDGNIDANVSLRSDTNGSNMFDTEGGLAYKITNGTTDGCNGIEVQTSYLNFTVTNNTDVNYLYPGCSNLTYGDLADEMRMYAQVALPPSTSTANTATIQFEANPSSG